MAGGALFAGADDVIRLKSRAAPAIGEPVEVNEPRHGFNYERFVARVESLWFQRKTLLASGRQEDAQAQLEEIRSFCSEEGVRRHEHLAGALIAEADRYHEQGATEQALSALEYAEAFDPDRPQIHMARAAVLWGANRELLGAGREVTRALRASAARSTRDLSLAPRVLFVFGLSVIAAALVHSLIMLLRYQAPLRHEIEELTAGRAGTRWGKVVGWTLLGLPLISWFGAGWAALFWVALCFRFMGRTEQLATAGLLLVGALTLPGYTLAVGLYGTSADPAVRTTVTSVEGEYDPDRVVRLLELVETHPEDPAYHFLLGGLYKNGRYFEEAFEEYKAVLELDPSFVAARINMGNVFYATGQYGAAIRTYHEALKDDPGSMLAHFNLHLAQSEDFHFKEAEQSLQRAREIDSDAVAKLLADTSAFEERQGVQDSSLRMASVWEAAVRGRSPGESLKSAGVSRISAGGLLNHVTLLCLASLGGGILLASVGRSRARRCIRCGRPFCERCRRGKEGREYCSQCLHLFVLRDGLEPETKASKVYEVRRYERRTRGLRALLSLTLPGAGQIARGKAAQGLPILIVWFALAITAVPEIGAAAGTGLRLSGDLLLASEVPTHFDPHPGRYLALALLPLVWIAGNWSLARRKEA